MDVRSTPSGMTPRPPLAGRTRHTGAPASPSRPVGTPPAAGDEMTLDRVELSPAAIELNAALEHGPAPTGGLTEQRARQVAERMTSGFYDRSETVDRIVDRIFSENSGSDAKA